MVLVEVYEFLIEPPHKINANLSVIGLVPTSSKKTMKFLTDWADSLRINHVKRKNLGQEISTIKDLMLELSRRKFKIATIPKNTYLLGQKKHKKRCNKKQQEQCVDIFVDEGSPFKHIYIVEGKNVYTFALGLQEGVFSKKPKGKHYEIKGKHYEINGFSPFENRSFIFWIDFISTKVFLEHINPEFIYKNTEKLAKDKKIYTIIAKKAYLNQDIKLFKKYLTIVRSYL